MHTNHNTVNSDLAELLCKSSIGLGMKGRQLEPPASAARAFSTRYIIISMVMDVCGPDHNHWATCGGEIRDAHSYLVSAPSGIAYVYGLAITRALRLERCVRDRDREA